MHSKKFKKSLVKRFIESAGILFSLILVLAAIVYAATPTSWPSGSAPLAAPGAGNVELGGSSLWTESGANIYRATGNVGIGTTAPGGKLDVNGDLYVRSSISGTNGVAGNTAYVLSYGGTDSGLLNLYSGGVLKNRLYANGDSYITGGNVGIGTTTPGEKLDVAGNIQASGDVCNGDSECIGDSVSITSIPTCTGSNFLQFNGTSFSCVTVPSLPPSCDPNICNGACDSGNGTWQCVSNVCTCAWSS